MRRVTLAARRAQRYLRRPPRPRWFRPAMIAAAVALLVGTVGGAFAWLSASGALIAARHQATDHLDAWSRALGLEVHEVYVNGRVRTSYEAVREAVAVQRGAPLLTLDPEQVRARVERLHWVASARIARRLPDTVAVDLTERQPLALWQRAGQLALIDRTGRVIEGVRPEAFGHLRVLVGEGAPAQAVRLFELLASEPGLAARVVAATWVGGRRWSLHLDNQVEVLLPEDDPDAAWRLLARKSRDDHLLERAVELVDLRFLPERMRLRMARPAVADRDA